ncbi:MAG: adenylosuccinate lyase [Candidatus Eisenbacteria sp.]|nr:adenylosuccinate lyase [Candidatus Eisenbacteria bacterium]
MISKYTRPEMGRLWTEENKFRVWWEIETLVMEVLASDGRVPVSLAPAMRKAKAPDPDEIAAVEKRTRHDVIAFLEVATRELGDDARYVHAGLTSSDLVDTAQAVRLRQAGLLLDRELGELETALAGQADRHRNTVMVGRTHGIHAEPITLGLKLAVWLDETRRNRDRLRRAVETVSHGKLSGSVGTFAHVGPHVEAYVCERLGLKPAPASTQIIQRDRVAEFLSTLAIVGGSLEKFATEIRGLQRTEIGELEEPFLAGQKGSSSMPHKRNPIICERIAGLARALRGYALAGFENMALWHERDISHSSVERIVLPDACILTDYVTARMTWVIDGLTVNTERMRENLNRTRGLVFSQRVLIELMEKGWARSDAYNLVESLATETLGGGPDLRERLKADQQVRATANAAEIDGWFDVTKYLQNLEQVYERVGL